MLKKYSKRAKASFHQLWHQKTSLTLALSENSEDNNVEKTSELITQALQDENKALKNECTEYRVILKHKHRSRG